MVSKRRMSLIQPEITNLEEIAEDEQIDSRVAQARELEKQKQNESQEKQAPNLKGDQLSAYIQNCVKLSQDNKITIKNAFDLQLIDYMISFAKGPKTATTADSTNFSLASMSLDASGKIYGYRVDSVHQDIFRLVSGLGVQKGSDDQDAPEDALQDPEQAKKPKRKKIRSTYISEEKANEATLELDYEIAGNDILTRVHHNDGNALGRIMSYDLFPIETETVDIEGQLPWWSTETLKDAQLSDENINCESLSGALPLSTHLLEQDMNDTVIVTNPNAENEPILDDLNDSIVFDPDAEPMPMVEDFGGGDDGPMMNDRDGMSIHPEGPLFTSIGPNDTEMSVAGDFSSTYLEKFKSSGLNFAGPSQFKVKRYNILGEKKNNPQPRGGQKKKETEFIQFADEETLPLFEHKTAEVPKKGSAAAKSKNVLTSLTMDRWSSDGTTLAVEFTAASFSRLSTLFELPTINISQTKKPPAEDTGEGRLIDYHDDADDRPISPCADDQFTEFGREAEHADRDFNLENIEAVENDFGVPPSQPVDDYDNLLSAPGIMAEKLTIGYTKAARKFNVRQMKESYWKVLTCEEDKSTMTGEKTFTELFREVMPHLSSTNRKNVSLPLAFVSVLMLCNEKHLMLSQRGELDFCIYQAPDPKTT